MKKIINITYGPIDPDTETAQLIATELIGKGYFRTSNAFQTVSRIDRIDWMKVLAREMRCSVVSWTNEYNQLCQNSQHQWKMQYIRIHSNDHLTVDSKVFRLMK